MLRFTLGSFALLLASTVSAQDKSIAVPYKRTETQHILVRAKINGEGPFHFILDTGAPISFISTPVGKKLGLDPAKKWATLDKFELEGGVQLPKTLIRVETPFQLEGMNGMGLPGAELHGILGYTELAKFKIEIDFTKSKMKWTPLDHAVAVPDLKRDKGESGAGGLEMIGTVMKFLGFLSGTKTTPDIRPRGYVGLELEVAKDGLNVTRVHKDSPAEKAGLKVGDRITQINGQAVLSLEEMNKQARQWIVGQALRLVVHRGGEDNTIRIVAGEGL